LFVTLISCSNENHIKDVIIGFWTYERTITSTIEPVTDVDVTGTIELFSDGTGRWESSLETYHFDLEWHLKDGGKAMVIKKKGFWNVRTVSFDLLNVNENEFTLSGTTHRIFQANAVLETKEQIVLTRN
jgi:hypothetical protein